MKDEESKNNIIIYGAFESINNEFVKKKKAIRVS